MKKLTAAVLAVLMLLPAAAGAQELSADEKAEKYGSYIMLDMTDSANQFERLEYNSEYKQVDYIDHSGLLERDIERGKVMQIYTKNNWTVPVTATWNSSWNDLSQYNYFSFYLNCRKTEDMMTKINITILSKDGQNDIVLPDIDCTDRMEERWYELSFPISAVPGVQYTGLKIEFYQSWIHIDDIAFSTKDPFSNPSGCGAYTVETFEGSDGGDLTTVGAMTGFNAAVKAYDGTGDARAKTVQKLFTQNAGEATFTRSFKAPLDLSKYRYLSLWAQTSAAQDMYLYLKDGQNILCEIPLNMTADNQWRKYSYFIGAMTKDADTIVIKNKSGTSQKAIYFDDITFSEGDPLACGDYFCTPLEISGGAVNGQLPAGTYTAGTTVVNNTKTAVENATCIVAVYDQDGTLLGVTAADKMEAFLGNNAAVDDGRIERTINVSENGSKIKFFIWNMDTINPLTEAVE